MTRPADGLSPDGVAEAPTPLELSKRFDAAALPGQFVLGRAHEPLPPNWPTFESGRWMLSAHPALPVRMMRAADGTLIGWLLGFPIDARGEWIEGDATLPVSATPGADEFERALYALGGRFLAILLTIADSRVYLDSGGSLSAVYSPAHEMVAATPSLVPYTLGCDDAADLIAATGMPYGGAMFAFGLTSRRGVERLLPNHFLDLTDWKAKRHWPATPLDEVANPGAVVEEVARVVERTMAAAARRGAFLPLTAGNDSRALLACAREHIGRLRLTTIAFPDRTARVDVEIARRIARRHGLRHRVLPCEEPRREDFEGWVWRTGFCLAGARGWQSVRAYQKLGPLALELTGAGGETARASYWRPLGAGKRVIDEHLLVGEMGLPHTHEILSRARAWLESLPARRPMHVVDFVYIEQRMGSWTGLLPYAHANSVLCRMHPFAHRDAITAMLRLPDAYKLEKRFQRDMIASRWPELLNEPFNREIGWRQWVYVTKRRVWLVRRKLTGAPR